MHPFHHHHRGASPQEAPPPAGPPLPPETSTEFKLISAGSARFERDGSRLLLRLEAQAEPVKVTAWRLFPLSYPDRWISVLDEKGREVGIIADLREFDHKSQSALREEVVRRYTVPQVIRILSCRDRFDTAEWEIETDRGVRRVRIRNLRESIQQRSMTHLMFTDVEGNRYDIPDIAGLDRRSRMLIERYL